MDFSLTAQQAAVREESLQLARSLPCVDRYDLDKRSTFDFPAWDHIVKSKVFSGFIPAEYGGRGWTTLDKVIALESFGYGCSDNGLALTLSSFVWTVLPPVLRFGSETQAKALVANVLRGDYLCADGITEEEAGSDAMAMQTSADARPDGYLINGGKTHIGLAPIAKELLLFAKTNPQAGSWGISVFLVDLDSKGITRSPNQEKMGLRTLPSGRITFENCFVPSDSLVGSEGSGLSIFNESMEWERGFILASQIGSMQRQLEACIEHVTSRKQFGKPIGKFQSVSNRIADMKIRLESCRLHLYRTAWLKDRDEDCALEASMTKLLISESFLSSSLDAIRLNGANGYLSEYEIERDLRDATGGLIYAGTSDIQRNLIARHSGL